MRLGMDIGGTHTILGLVDDTGAVLHRAKRKTPPAGDLQAFALAIKAMVDTLLAEAQYTLADVAFCGAGVPGTVSPDGQTVLLAPNLGWDNAGVAKALQAALGLPVKLIQDSRAAAYGEYRSGAGQGCQTVVCITLGTGIGTGIVMRGQVFSGELYSAGELGHTPVVPDGRVCGCGQKGCLECYTAGKGFTMTAQALWGDDADCEMLFARALEGDTQANEAIAFAVSELGKTLVGMLNLLSPDCLLFSGGLSQQQALLVRPLLQYMEEKRYHAPHQPPLRMGLAALGEDAAMIGAALLPPNPQPLPPLLSASLMCADWLHLADDLTALAEAGIDYLHCDIMDGHFVPNLMIPPEVLQKLRTGTALPFDIHIMTEHPEAVLRMLDLRPGDLVTVHAESTVHLQRVLAQIKTMGAQAGVAINPATPVESIREVLPDIALVLLMTVNPGYAGQQLVPQCVPKIKRLRQLLDGEGYPHVRIAVDGNCTPENVARFSAMGADLFVLGSSGLFRPDQSLRQAAAYIRQTLQGGTENA